MRAASPSLNFFLNLARAQTVLTRRFDRSLGGLGFNEFVILYHLSAAEGQKLPRVELAERVGLTASGITRLLLPMEKVGLVKRQASTEDGRISYVVLAPGGKRRLDETLERAELICEDLRRNTQTKKISEFSAMLSELAQRA